MRYKVFLLFMSSCLLSILTTFGQTNFSQNNTPFDFGLGVKLNIEFGHRLGLNILKSKNFYRPGFKLSITGGVGYKTKGDFSIYPALHSGVLIFNKSAIGANQSIDGPSIQSHFFINANTTFQLDRKDFSQLFKNLPLYHFAEFTANPLQNPFKSSISLGANWIFLQKGKKQRISFLNINMAGKAQISYYNDGGPVHNIFGDKRDRYYTGGVILSYHGNYNDRVDLIEVSYHKYTGYQKHAFDIGDKLQIDFLNYKDPNQFEYNQQRWRLNFSSLKTGFGGSLSLYNFNKIDLQDFIHFNTNVPYHPDYFRGYRLMYGASYQANYTNQTK